MDFPDSRQVLADHMHEHPIITFYQRTGDHRVVKISDFLTRRQFHRLGLYAEFFRPMGIEDLIVATLPFRPPLQLGFALCRKQRDFTESDRLLLELLRPHLAQAYRNAEAVMQAAHEVALRDQALEVSNHAVVVVRPDGRIQTTSPRARGWFAEYWNAPARTGDRLPEALRRWVVHHRQTLTARDASVPLPLAPLVVERDGKRLVVRPLLDDGRILLLFEERRAEVDAARLQAIGLTRRETEVLTWVAEGKTNWEIGQILGARPRTVGKHLENIYRKLGVETRTAAAHIALAAPVAI